MKTWTLTLLFFVSTIRVLTAQPYGLEERIPNTSLLISTGADSLNDIVLNPVFTNLNFNRIVFITNANDGSNRIFVVQQNGDIYVFENDVNVTSAQLFLRVENNLDDSPNEGGLLGLAFHPDYTTNKKFYVQYTATVSGNFLSRISEFQTSNDPNVADSQSERILLETMQPGMNHNGGMLAFGADGYLYIGLGDGGTGGAPAQDRSSILGSVLRIDVDNIDENLQYAIPANNPYFNNEQGFREEIWAYGLRNPWRFSFDAILGTLWCGDVGSDNWEEIDIIGKGKNYGWNITEGFHCNGSSSCDTTGITFPVTEYSHEFGCSVIGGYVYRGALFPSLQGIYFYGDLCTGNIWGLEYSGGEITQNKIVYQNGPTISTFGQDENRELYVTEWWDGKIFRIEEKTSIDTSNIPQSISESGLYSDILTKDISPGLIPYSVNSPLWSNGTFKERYIALPDTTKIIFSGNNPWSFPQSTVLVKNFFLQIDKTNPDSKKIIETRFLVKRKTGDLWDGLSYMWNDSESDASLLSGSATKSFIIYDPDSSGGQYEYEYYYPSRNDCRTCHTSAAGYTLGVNTKQLNKEHLYNNQVTDNQLRSYNNIRLFTNDIGENYETFPSLPDPSDLSFGIEDRSRSYLDANCSQCHRPGGTGRSNMDLRYSVALNSTNLFDEPEYDNLGIENAKRINPGEPDSSIVYLRLARSDNKRMPPLAVNIIDTLGTNLIKNWIDRLAPTYVDESLPVFLGSFNAYKFNNSIKITWSTISETGNLGFIILKSVKYDGEYSVLSSYTKTNSLKGTGNSSELKEYSYIDHDVLLGGDYYYKINSIDINGKINIFGPIKANWNQNVDKIDLTDLPKVFNLYQNFPNPFNSSTKIEFDIPSLNDNSISVHLYIYDVLGRMIKKLFSGKIISGKYVSNWDGTDDLGNKVKSGIYLYKLVSEQFSKSGRMVLIK